MEAQLDFGAYGDRQGEQGLRDEIAKYYQITWRSVMLRKLWYAEVLLTL